MSHALATVLHSGRKAASNIMSACLASSRGHVSPEHKHGHAYGNGQSRGQRRRAGTEMSRTRVTVCCGGGRGNPESCTP